MIWPFRKKPVPAVVKKQKPVRVTVYLQNGATISHYACFRTIRDDGTLNLHDEKGGGKCIADYAPGTWISISVGKRCVSNGQD
jgi:hypothetical protein